MGTDAPVVETHELTKKYGQFLALDRLTMSVERGQILGFIGPNGAGKTTTIKILVGLVRPTSGSAAIAGVDCVREGRRLKRLGGDMAGTVWSFHQLGRRRVLRLFWGGFRLTR